MGTYYFLNYRVIAKEKLFQRKRALGRSLGKMKIHPHKNLEDIGNSDKIIAYAERNEFNKTLKMITTLCP